MENFDSIVEYHLKKVGPQSAEKIADKLFDSISTLEDFPLSAPVYEDPFLAMQGFRKLVCGDYVAVYNIMDDTVMIHGIFHGSTNYPERLK